MAGAEVVEVPVYRWMPPADIAPVDRLLDAVVAGRHRRRRVHQRARRGEPAGPGARAADARRPAAGAARAGAGAVRRAGHGGAAGGAWTCRPCSPSAPGSAPWCGGWRPRCPPARGGCRWPGTGWSCAGTPCSSTVTCGAVAPAGMALLRALARRPGRVVARAELLRALPGAGVDEHAVETAMPACAPRWASRSWCRRSSSGATGSRSTRRPGPSGGGTASTGTPGERACERVVGAAPGRSVDRAQRVVGAAPARGVDRARRGRVVSEPASGSSAQRLRETSTERSGGER